MKCTGVIFDDGYEGRHMPCKCPICGGFLKWVNDKSDEQIPVCNRCKTELIVIPIDHDSENEHWDWDSKICPISEKKISGDAFTEKGRGRRLR